MRVGKRERDEGGKKRGGMWVGRRERDEGGKKRGGMRMGRRGWEELLSQQLDTQRKQME